jgi:hypothetical protein
MHDPPDGDNGNSFHVPLLGVYAFTQPKRAAFLRLYRSDQAQLGFEKVGDEHVQGAVRQHVLYGDPRR